MGELDRLESRTLKSGPRVVGSAAMEKAPELYLYGVDNDEPVYAWDKKQARQQEEASGPGLPFRLREARITNRDVTKEPVFNRITLGDREMGAGTASLYTDY